MKKIYLTISISLLIQCLVFFWMQDNTNKPNYYRDITYANRYKIKWKFRPSSACKVDIFRSVDDSRPFEFPSDSTEMRWKLIHSFSIDGFVVSSVTSWTAPDYDYGRRPSGLLFTFGSNHHQRFIILAQSHDKMTTVLDATCLWSSHLPFEMVDLDGDGLQEIIIVPDTGHNKPISSANVEIWKWSIQKKTYIKKRVCKYSERLQPLN